MGFQKIKKAYEELYAVGSEICQLCEEGKYEELQASFVRKESAFKATQKINISEDFSDDELRELKKIIEKIEENDKKILEKIEKHKEELRKELNSISKNSKAVSAYKLSLSEYKPILFDTRE